MVGKLKKLIAAFLLRLTRYSSAVVSSASAVPVLSFNQTELKLISPLQASPNLTVMYAIGGLETDK